MSTNYEEKYHQIMGLLQGLMMAHGCCQPRELRACTHCNASDDIKALVAAYKGPDMRTQTTRAPMRIEPPKGGRRGDEQLRDLGQSVMDRWTGTGPEMMTLLQMAQTIPVDKCNDCHECLRGKLDEASGWLPATSVRMILCPICGNKRCPKATNHNFPCTGSNDTGQPGSIYK